MEKYKTLEKQTNQSTIPRHVAIIMDGNGRWAKKRAQPRSFGHRKAEGAISKTVEYCLNKQVAALTFFVFSTENWKRPKEEINYVMHLLEKFLKKSTKLMLEKEVRLLWIGYKQNVPAKIRTLFEELIEKTKCHRRLQLCLAVDYGAKSEIIEVVKEVARMSQNGILKTEDISEDLIENLLYTKELPALDLLIRTSGECRLSNFLLWQAAYAELYFSDALWPDFDEAELDKAFHSYSLRSRRWGTV